MSKKICILYSTVDGHTFKICNYIKAKFTSNNFSVDLFEVGEFTGTISDYDLFIIGASIRYGYHRKNVIEFINKNIEELNKVKNAFFSVNIVARKIGRDRFDNNPYVKKFFEKQVSWRPNIIDVFAGVLDYPSYNLFDRIMIKFIMTLTKGPTKGDKPMEFTDWSRVDTFIKNTENLIA